MENTPQDPAHLRREFQPCRNRFTAFGARRGGTCCASCCLPRLQVLRETGVIKARKEATHVFYYLALQDSGIENVARLFADILQILRNAPDKSGED